MPLGFHFRFQRSIVRVLRALGSVAKIDHLHGRSPIKARPRRATIKRATNAAAR
jgi:hypothetical protein